MEISRRFRLTPAGRRSSIVSFFLILVPLLLFAGIVGYQVVGPTPFGLADNNDFARVLGPLRLWPAPPFRNDPHRVFGYFVDDYVVGDRYDLGVPTSEWLVAALAKRIARVSLPHGTFKLHLMGEIHAAVSIGALLILLLALRNRAWWVRILGALVPILVWTDVQYVQQLNTAYTDAGAVAAIEVLFAIAVYTLLVSRSWKWAAGFVLAGGFLLATKTQHETVLPFLMAFCVFTGVLARCRLDRMAWFVVPPLLLATSVWIVVKTPGEYRGAPAFTIVFFKLAVLSRDPKGVLAEFHFPEREYLKYVGHYAYEPMVPIDDMSFRRQIIHLVTPRTLGLYYARHPEMLKKVLLFDLHGSAPNVDLQIGYGRWRRIDIQNGIQPFHLTEWSGFRQKLFSLAPDHPIWLFGCAILLCAGCLLKTGFGRRLPLWPMILVFSMVSISAFVFASLLDGIETSRHLVLFQTAMDLTLISLAFSALFAIEDCLRESARAKVVDGKESGHAPAAAGICSMVVRFPRRVCGVRWRGRAGISRAILRFIRLPQNIYASSG